MMQVFMFSNISTVQYGRKPGVFQIMIKGRNPRYYKTKECTVNTTEYTVL
jgi:hypothetical protein